MTIDPCGPDCIAQDPILDTASGREHDNCPDPALCRNCRCDNINASSTSGLCVDCEILQADEDDEFARYLDEGRPMSRMMTRDEMTEVYLELK